MPRGGPDIGSSPIAGAAVATPPRPRSRIAPGQSVRRFRHSFMVRRSVARHSYRVDDRRSPGARRAGRTAADALEHAR